MTDELQRTFDAAINRAVKQHNIAIDFLTEQQVCEVFKQAIASGDITRNVLVDNGAQSVSYVPFREKERLEREIKELRAEIYALANPDSRTYGQWPVILYFKTEEDKDKFVSDVKSALPHLKDRKVSCPSV